MTSCNAKALLFHGVSTAQPVMRWQQVQDEALHHTPESLNMG